MRARCSRLVLRKPRPHSELLARGHAYSVAARPLLLGERRRNVSYLATRIRARRYARLRRFILIATLVLPVLGVGANITPAAATYHPGVYQWHSVYFPDGTYQGADKNQADFYTWSDGTESVSNLYAGISRGPYHPGTFMVYDNAWVLNYDGSTALYVNFYRTDCGLYCVWNQNIWSGWTTVYAQSQYSLMQHVIYWGCCRTASQPVMLLNWP